jgi:predicted transcriptional regulator
MEMSNLLSIYFKQNTKDVREQRAAISKVLKSGPTTISVIAETTGYPKDLILWNILGMLKWGTIEIENEHGEELTYALKEVK